ncbi:hypothetical protein YTPLAS18_16920 [Nitrospira sp.]|nr:hypothetical protein YTPLAS18_16920 [Nitrospira sp.]
MVVILCATTVYSNVFVGHSHWMLVKWIPFYRYGSWTEYFLDLGQNLLLFLPLGYAQPRAGLAGTAHPLRVIAITGLLVSTGIELFQVYSHNRSPATTDIVVNGIGSLLGGAWSLYVTRRISATSPDQRRPLPVLSNNESRTE